MFGFLRAMGVALASLTFVAGFAAPAMAAEGETAPLAVQSASIATVSTALSAPQAAAIPAVAPALLPQAVATLFAPQQPRPLKDMVNAFVDYGNQDAEQECLAKAVYFEARGETIEGQLAVAEVILNRTASGVYPASVCGVVTQPAQFSFIRGGKFPTVDRNSDCWHRALAIADIAQKRLAKQVPTNVLWYHASYVAPSWGRRLTRVAQIGTHIFYS